MIVGVTFLVRENVYLTKGDGVAGTADCLRLMNVREKVAQLAVICTRGPTLAE